MHNERCTSGSEGGPKKPGGRKADRALRSDPTLNPLKRDDGPGNAVTVLSPSFRTLILLATALLAAACACPVRADGSPQAATPEADARRLAEEVLRRAESSGPEGLGAWTRGVIDRALERAGETARQTVPGASGPAAARLPAERHAAATGTGLAGRPNSGEVIVFLSLSVPSASWRQWADDAARADVPLVLCGVGEGGLPGTAKRIGERLGGAEAGVAIDPRLFRLFGVTQVPAVVVAPGGVPPCASRGCAEDPPPDHDRIAGNIGLAAALEAVAAEGEAGRHTARRHLERMQGGERR